MNSLDKIPLNYEASEGDTHKKLTTSLPQEVVQCLENARFLHLATCSDNVPNVSLMNYTYLPSSPYNSSPVIIMTTNPASRKTTSILSNPNVSLLVHDWVSHRPPSHTRRPSGGSPTREPPSSLASLLLNLNSSEISSISATIGGAARIIQTGSEEEKYFCDQHLANHTYDDEDNQLFRQRSNPGSDSRTGQFVAGREVSVIAVEIKDVRISDYKGAVRDWAIVPEESLVNGST
ncbi:unnamed protein product [Clonostachys rhizophaga]|uniref:Pyridoxamine 5'-phosphate oxidase N-terminal domain-containing protein n=1 Tax=Clonostachys rhizophaga TaxID=160324 RepID=A0A9N9V833_9HYPO|nr:unnamed protein product [Clonostachys rhizophaga]